VETAQTNLVSKNPSVW